MTLFLAGMAGLGFLVAMLGLFWEAIPTDWWSGLVIMAVVASLLLYVLYFGVWMITPILVDAVLLWGVLTKRWSAETLRLQIESNVSARIHPLMNIPVPWVFILTFLVGLGVQYFVPLTVQSARIILISHIAGLVFTLIGVLLAFSSLRIFRAVRTTTIPFQKASELVTWGPYRFTRNPMYVGLTLIYLGEVGFLAQIWPLLLLPLPLIYVDRIVIPFEEARLREVFGAAYQQYCERVRRWI